MKTQIRVLQRTALAVAITMVIGGVASLDRSIETETGMSSFISAAYAGDGGSGGGQKGAMGAGRGGQGGQGVGGQGQGQGQRGGKSVADVLADDDDGDDSDRPDWAGVPGGEGRPGGGGNDDSGTTKGDVYGDMILLVRDPLTGLPVMAADENGNLWPQACTSADCSTSVLMVDNEVPAGETTFEVDLGRGSIVRAPTNVMESRLDEALSVINSAASISLDEAGRIVVTDADGVSKTIDSPLENLALYIDLMKGLTDPDGSATVSALGDLATLSTAASLLGGMADKTGDISLDYLMYENLISGIVASADEAYDFSTFTYVRDYDTSYDFWYSPDGVAAPVAKTLDINAYLDYVNGNTLPAPGAALFATAADDAVEVIELLHTQIVTDDFLNGFDQF